MRIVQSGGTLQRASTDSIFFPMPNETQESPLLFRKFPLLKEVLPWTPLGSFPTPVHRLDKLGSHLGMNELWIKRDDLTGEEYGGNKVRKLEFLLADVMARGRRRIVPIGAIGSNFVTATSFYAKKLGLEPIAMLFPQPVTDVVKRNLLMDIGVGAEIYYTPSLATLPFTIMKPYFKYGFFSSPAEKPKILPWGGTTAASTVGYVQAAFELKEQIERGECPRPDYIFVTLGTSGTAAGLALGLELAGLCSTLIGIRVVDLIISNARALRYHARNAYKIMAKSSEPAFQREIKLDNFKIIHDYFGKGYGYATEDGNEAMRIISEKEGITLEGTYTGKTLGGMIGSVNEMNLKDKVVLFWNTFNSRDITPHLAPPESIETLPKRLKKKLKS